jgi:hypothetical protein
MGQQPKPNMRQSLTSIRNVHVAVWSLEKKKNNLCIVIKTGVIKTYNNRIQLTVKSVTLFAKQKNAPLFTSADAGVNPR